jgi:hypothetical protein
VGDNEQPGAAQQRVNTEYGVAEWWTPLDRRRPEHSGPRVTEDGLKVPAWWTDDEQESQQMLAAQGVMLDA